MEITSASCSNLLSQSLLSRTPLLALHYQLPLLSLRRLSRPSSLASTSCCRGHRLHTPLPPSSLFQHPRFPLISCRKPLTTTHSLSDDSASVKAVDVDPAVAVKKKAMEISPALKGTSIFLVGMNNSIKTSVGKLLADALRYYYFDSDNLVEEAAGVESDGKSFKERDVEGFCESETEVLKQLSSMGRMVVCAGNGAVQSASNLALLRHGLSVWIDMPLEMVARDATENGTQFSASEIFISGSNSEVFNHLTMMYEEMRGGYATADATVSLQKVVSKLGYDDFDAVTREDMALEVLEEIEKLMRKKKMMEEAARPF
ncbi:hypothetical protein NMG60_11006886 [Bertholletia excelsa]